MTMTIIAGELKVPDQELSELEPAEVSPGRLDLLKARHEKLKAKERVLEPAQMAMSGASEIRDLVDAVRDLSTAVLAAAAIPALVERCGRQLDEGWVSKAAITIGAEVMRALTGKVRKRRTGRPRKKALGK